VPANVNTSAIASAPGKSNENSTEGRLKNGPIGTFRGKQKVHVDRKSLEDLDLQAARLARDIDSPECM
jgi:hypothetical protein